MQPSPHGVWRTSAYGRDLILTEVSGCCNRQGALKYTDEFKRLAQQAIDLTSPWITLMRLKADCYTTPDVVEPMLAFSQWCSQHNRIALVSIISSSLMEYEQRKMLFLNRQSGFQYLPYCSIEQAVAQVNQLGVTLPIEDYYHWLGIKRKNAEIIPLRGKSRT